MITALLAEFNTKLRDLEEKQRLMNDRIIMLSKNLVKEKDESQESSLDLKKSVEEIKYDLLKTKSALSRILEEMENYASKSDLEILQRQSKMFQPLELARISDVERMIKDLNSGKHKS
jgi:hypothetical protein